MNDSVSLDDLGRKRLQFLWAAGSIYATRRPQLSRHFVSKFASFTEKPALNDLGTEVKHEYCPHCHTILLPDNHEVSFKSKSRQSDRIRRLQKRADQQTLMSNKQRKLLRHWMNSTNKMSILCKVCHKRSQYAGGKRHLVTGTKSYYLIANTTDKRRSNTPNQSPRTPMVHNRSWTSTTPESTKSWSNSLRTSTPFSTSSSRTPPRSTPLSGSSGRSSKKSKRDKHQQLQKMLASAKKEKEEAAKSPLNAFLKSL